MVWNPFSRKKTTQQAPATLTVKGVPANGGMQQAMSSKSPPHKVGPTLFCRFKVILSSSGHDMIELAIDKIYELIHTMN